MLCFLSEQLREYLRHQHLRFVLEKPRLWLGICLRWQQTKIILKTAGEQPEFCILPPVFNKTP
jgi:hypothetical protein